MYQIMIEQDRSFMTNEPAKFFYKLKEITDIRVMKNCYSQIGHYSKCARCRNIMIMPTGLTIVPFVVGEEEAMCVTQDLSKIYEQENVELQLYLPEEYGGGKQTIRIEKVN